jgi:hypothetical protein
MKCYVVQHLIIALGGVWNRDRYCFSKCFSFGNLSKYYFFKIYFWHQHIKTIQKQKQINLKQKQISNFFKTPVQPQDQTPPNSHG